MKALMSYLPENYPASRETVTFQEALQPEVTAIWEARDSLLAQLNPYTADWGLDYWEDALGLGTCQGIPLDTRRRQVVAKLQGRATTTPQVVKDVAETMLGVPVTVIEHFGEYRVELEVSSGGKLPAGAAQLKGRLGEIMPAHLDWALVIPILLHIPIHTAPAPRIGRTAPPPYRAQLGPGHIPAACGLGMRYSTVTLPMAVGRLPDRSFARRANDGPMAAGRPLPYPSTTKEVKTDGL